MSNDRMKQPYEMPFAEFAAAVRPSGAVNRLPQIGRGDPVLSYSVYMNGPAAKELPASAQEHLFRDVMVHALTDKLGLDSKSFRDNMKVAELVATRSAWMTAVLESSVDRSADRFTRGAQARELPAEVVRDYEMLSEGSGLGHPWMQAQIRTQLALSKNLRPAIDAAEQAVGGPVKERVPREVESGKIVSQNLDFTVQQIGDGEVVAHENRRLESLPELGKDVTVTYYRGQGQVVENTRELKMSEPYIEKSSGDLAVSLLGKQGEVKEVVLFNGVSSFAQFVTDHKLDSSLVEKALDARAATPKVQPVERKPERSPASDIYFDKKQEALAYDFVENGRKHTVLFSGPEAVASKANEYGLSADQVKQADTLSKAVAHAQANFPNSKEAQHKLIDKTADALKARAASMQREQEPERKEGRDHDRAR